MTFAFGFHPEAQAEFTADVEWYDARDTDMGGRFAGFPYRVVYLADDNAVTIVAVAHTKRRPGYWRARAGV